ncbi:MAG: hypothetical protein V2A73_19165 [Pseudomonadota bacterium]
MNNSNKTKKNSKAAYRKISTGREKPMDVDQPIIGRPRNRLSHPEDFSTLGEPPMDDPLALADWVQRALAIDCWRMLRGRADHQHSQELRAFARTIAATGGKRRIYQAERLLRADADRLRDKSSGPEPEPVTPAGEVEWISGPVPRGGGQR